ncbi:MAG TPA: hypothetical protein VK756_11770 [Solirubrobacteraceae bacterium]|nr:hypothetical protein [Solirubrobacteraceae bacterium]
MPDGQLLTGHVAEWTELLALLQERRGLTVIVADPLSGTGALLSAALKHSALTSVLVDARRCANPTDLAIAIADEAIAALAPNATAWWMGAAPPSSTASLRVSRLLDKHGIDPQRLRSGDGRPGSSPFDALALTTVLADGPVTLAIDHLGYMLANIRDAAAREILGALRTARQQTSDLDLLLVDHPDGPVSRALSDERHPLYRAGERLRIRRPAPSRIVEDLAITKPLIRTPVALLRAAAELATGVPALTWQAIALAPNDGESPTRALSGWETLRRATAVSVRREWDLLRRVHPAAQTIVAAVSLGLKPHNAPAASKTIDDGLNRLRDVGMAWQPAERTWAIADPLLSAYAREHAQP